MLSVVRNFVLLAEVDFVGVLATAKCKESGGEKLRCNWKLLTYAFWPVRLVLLVVTFIPLSNW